MREFSIVVALSAFTAFVSALTVNTPNDLVQCQPSQLQWLGGTPPYYVSIIPGGQPSSPALKEFPAQSGTGLVWNVTLMANTLITVAVRDGTGQQAYTNIVTVQNSPDSGCVDSAVSATAVSSINAATSAAPPHASNATHRAASGAAASGNATLSGPNRSATSTSAFPSATSTHASSSGTLHRVSAIAAGIASTLGFAFAVLF